MSNRIDRKEIARLIDVTPKQVRRNERRWGLDKFRCDLNCRFVCYCRHDVLTLFRKRGWIRADTDGRGIT